MPIPSFAARPMPEPVDLGTPSFGAMPPAPTPAPAPIIVPPSPVPMTPPPTAPAPPAFGGMVQPEQAPGAKLAQMIPALLVGLKNPELVGAALRGLQKGRDAKLARQEHAQQTQDRRAREATEFYARAVQESSAITDPVDFEHWRQAMGPVAQYYGIDPHAFAFNATRAQKSMQSKLVASLDAMEKRDPSLASRDDFKVVTEDYPQGISAATVRSWRGQAQDSSGKAILPAQKPDALTPNTPEEQFYAQYAKTKGAKSFAELAPEEQVKAREQWAAGGRSDAGGSDYAKFLARFAKEKGKTVDALTVAEEKQAKKEFGTADDKATNGPRDRFNVQQVTNADGSTGLIRVNMETGEATPVVLPTGTGGAGKAGDTERLSKAYYDRTIASDKTALDFEKSLTGLGSQLDVQLPNLLKSEQGQQYQQAKDEFINAALRRESGAAIQPSEYTRFDKIYFVMPGDTAATIKQKQAARKRVVDGFKVTAGNLGGAAPATGGVVKWGRDKNGNPVRLSQ